MKKGEIHPPVRAGQPLPGPGGEVLRWARNTSPPGLDNPSEIMRGKKVKGGKQSHWLTKRWGMWHKFFRELKDIAKCKVQNGK